MKVFDLEKTEKSIKEIEKEIKKLNIPSKYKIVNLRKFFSHDFYLQLSIREDSGKTTQALILGLVLNKLYGWTIEYNRSDKAQTTKANIETLFDTVETFGYIAKIYGNKWNGIEYKAHVKKFYLIKTELNKETGEVEIVDRNVEPILVVHSLEEWQKIKSSYNNPKGNFFLFDEFMDSERSGLRQMIELQNNISTIGRKRPEFHVLMLGNNVNQFSFWFEEFCIEDDIKNLEFGGNIDKTTELGTTLYCELVELSDTKKEENAKRKVRFSGFNTPKMNAFNGLSAWQGSSHPHIPYDEMLSEDIPKNCRIFIKHRGRYVQIVTYKSETYGTYCYLHYANEPKYNDNLILTISPIFSNEIYAFGKWLGDGKRKRILQFIAKLKESNKWYYASNSVGDLVEDFYRTVRKG